MLIILCGLKETQDRQANLEQKEMDCCICFETILGRRYTSKCAHSYCEICILEWFISQFELGQSIKTCPCPLCRSDIREDIQIFFSKIDRYDIDNLEENVIVMFHQHNINTWIALQFQ